MKVCESVAIDFMHSSQLTCVRTIKDDEVVSEASIDDVGSVLEIAGSVHGSHGRTVEHFRNRFEQGRRCFLLSKAGIPASYVWLSLGTYPIFPIRTRLLLPNGVGLFFDEATSPCFRRLGMLGKLMAASWSAAQLHGACLCIVEGNATSWGANSRLGFRRFATCGFRRVGPVRRQDIRLEDGRSVHHYSLARLGPNVSDLACELDGRSATFSLNGSRLLRTCLTDGSLACPEPPCLEDFRPSDRSLFPIFGSEPAGGQ